MATRHGGNTADPEVKKKPVNFLCEIPNIVRQKLQPPPPPQVSRSAPPPHKYVCVYHQTVTMGLLIR